MYRPQRQGAVQFAELLDAVSDVDPCMRVRFTSPHPKDFSDDVLQVRLDIRGLTSAAAAGWGQRQPQAGRRAAPARMAPL